MAELGWDGERPLTAETLAFLSPAVFPTPNARHAVGAQTLRVCLHMIEVTEHSESTLLKDREGPPIRVVMCEINKLSLWHAVGIQDCSKINEITKHTGPWA